ncbi:MAG: DUF4249 domain-containing protein [Muribaculaceae bacterium]
MAILRNITTIMLAALLASCYENFEPEIDTKPVLCINSLITAGEPIEVEVTHTWAYNDKESALNHGVSDAKVVILANEKLVGADYLPKEGDKVRIVAESATYGTATADVMVPIASPIGKVKATPVATGVSRYDDEYAGYEMTVSISFNLDVEIDVEDIAGADNYYHFTYRGFTEDADNETNQGDELYSTLNVGSFKNNYEPIFGEHVGTFETVMGNEDVTGFTFFTDRQFPGKTYTLHLRFENNRFTAESEEYDESQVECGVNLYIATVSASYYNWAVRKWHTEEGVSGDLSEIGLAETRWGYSNVSTGAGVVAAQSLRRYSVNLNEFIKTTLKQQ